MADINPNLPAINEPNSTADPKILSALSTLVSTVNNLESSNLAAGAITMEKLAADITDLLVPVGSLMDYSGASDPIAGKWILADGRELSRTTYASLFSLLGGASNPYGAGDGSTTFNIPDFRGRTTVAPDSMGTAKGDAGRLPDNDTRGAAGGTSQYQLSASQIPQLTFTPQGTISGSTTGGGHGHSGTTGNDSWNGAGSGITQYNVNVQPLFNVYIGSGSTLMSYTSHTHSFSTSGANDGAHGHGLSATFTGTQGSVGSASPSNVDTRQPYVVVNKIIRIS